MLILDTPPVVHYELIFFKVNFVTIVNITILLALKLYCEGENTYFPFLIVSVEGMDHPSIFFPEEIGTSGPLLPSDPSLSSPPGRWHNSPDWWMGLALCLSGLPFRASLCHAAHFLCSSLQFTYWGSSAPRNRPALLELGWIQFSRML